jgi:outer membrane lipoprotein-sorting protein
LWALALLLQAASAQPRPDVAEILQKVSAAYKGASQYELTLDETRTPQGNHQPESAHARVVFKAPNQYRMESTVSGSADDDPTLDETVLIHNGSTLWIYLPRSNQYLSYPADKAADDPELSAHTPEAADPLFMEKYRDAADYAAGAKLIREEGIEFAGVKVSCYVVSVPEKAQRPFTWWVDKLSYRILREVSASETTVYTTVKLGEPLPENVFQFEPPPGARQIDVN